MRILLFLLTLSVLAWSSIGNVGALKGSATVTRGGELLDVTHGMALEESDTIRTSAKSQLQVILKDDTSVTIGPDSTFVFDAYKFGGKDDTVVKMRIDRGFFRSVTGKIGKIAPERFKVKTSSATIGIRGTDFSALVTDQKETITCYMGGIDVFSETSTIAVDAGMVLDLTRDRGVLRRLEHTPSKAGQKRGAVEQVQEESEGPAVSDEQLSDVTQQEVQSTLSDDPAVPDHLEEPSVGFEDR